MSSHRWRTEMDDSAVVEFVDFRPGWEPALRAFFEALDAAGDTRFFDPHPYDAATLQMLASRGGRDVHCLLVESGRVLGYGLLRGWDAGFDIPSLGIAIHPAARAAGLGNLLMDYLEVIAARRGAHAVRLRVSKQNAVAKILYERRGYRWEEDPGDAGLLVGLKPLLVGGA